MHKIFLLLFGVFVMASGCWKDEVLDYKRPVLGIEDYYDFIGMSEQDYLEMYPYSLPENYYSFERLETFLEGDKDKNIFKIFLYFREGKCFKITSSTYTTGNNIEMILSIIDRVEKSSKAFTGGSLKYVERYADSSKEYFVSFSSIDEFYAWLEGKSPEMLATITSIYIAYEYQVVGQDRDIELRFNQDEGGCSHSISTYLPGQPF